jgi:RNA polymerase sporulation-specific sigma factor
MEGIENEIINKTKLQHTNFEEKLQEILTGVNPRKEKEKQLKQEEEKMKQHLKDIENERKIDFILNNCTNIIDGIQEHKLELLGNDYNEYDDINTFDANKNIKLATYSSRCIENEILMHLRKMTKIRNEVSIDEPLNVDWDGNELLLSDILGGDPESVNKDIENEVDMKLLNNAINKLNGREKNIMELRFGLNSGKEKTQKEVADMLGISQSYISRLEKKIIKRLRKEISKMM